MIRLNTDKPIRVLCCTRLSRQGASSRYRHYQFLPYLQRQGFEIDVLPLLDDAYLQTRYTAGRRSAMHTIPGYLRRWLRLWRGRQWDLLWLEKEAFPWIPRWIETLSLPRTVPYVVDYDDAEFHRYDTHHFAPVRFLLGRKIDGVMRGAAMVVAGNEYIAERARQAGAALVESLPTVVDLDRYPLTPPPRNKTFTIGWIGTPMTVPFLKPAHAALRELCRDGAARLVTVGSGPLSLPDTPVETRPWSEATEARDIQDFDVGIMPLPGTLSNRGKCGLKLIQYMAAGRPVVGTPVGVNAEIIDHGVNGFRATTTEQWVQALEKLRDDAALRNSMGQAGRMLVEERYSLEVAAPRLAELLRTAATRTRQASM